MELWCPAVSCAVPHRCCRVRNRATCACHAGAIRQPEVMSGDCGGAVISDRASSSVGLHCHPANSVQARTAVRRKAPPRRRGQVQGEAECASKRKPTPRLYPTAANEAGSWARDESRLHESGIRLTDRHNNTTTRVHASLVRAARTLSMPTRNRTTEALPTMMARTRNTRTTERQRLVFAPSIT